MAGARSGYLDLISAATPAVSAHAGLAPLTSQYWLSLPCAGTSTPGAATWTDRVSLEKASALPALFTAASPGTPGLSSGKAYCAGALARASAASPVLSRQALTTTPQ